MGPGPQAPPWAAEGRAGAESSWAKQGAGGAGARLPCSVPKAQGHGGRGPSLGAVHTLCTATDAPAHTGGLSTHHLIFRKPTTRCQGSFISFFFDTCTDINIFLVPMVAIFKRGWSWLCSLSMQFYLSWTFHTSSVPWLWGQVGGFPKPLPSLVPPKISHQRPSSSPAWGLPICWGNALRWLLPLPRGALLPSYILSKPAWGLPRACLPPKNGPFVEQLTVVEAKSLSSGSGRRKACGVVSP